MLKHAVIAMAAGLLVSAVTLPAVAQDQQPAPQQEQIYGSELMTEAERAEHRARMRAAATAEEREQIRREHHELMKERAMERGMTLPDDPPAERGGVNRSGSGDSRGR